MKDFNSATEYQNYINELIDKYKYKPLPPLISAEAKKAYKQFFETYFDSSLYFTNVRDRIENGIIAYRYSRIVIGDYGAFIEIPPHEIVEENIMVKPGQEKRFTEQYKNCKYYWYCPRSDQNCRIYLQRRTVDYSDYKSGYFYVSPIDCVVLARNDKKQFISFCFKGGVLEIS